MWCVRYYYGLVIFGPHTCIRIQNLTFKNHQKIRQAKKMVPQTFIHSCIGLSNKVEWSECAWTLSSHHSLTQSLHSWVVCALKYAMLLHVEISMTHNKNLYIGRTEHDVRICSSMHVFHFDSGANSVYYACIFMVRSLLPLIFWTMSKPLCVSILNGYTERTHLNQSLCLFFVLGIVRVHKNIFCVLHGRWWAEQYWNGVGWLGKNKAALEKWEMVKDVCS